MSDTFRHFLATTQILRVSSIVQAVELQCFNDRKKKMHMLGSVLKNVHIFYTVLYSTIFVYDAVKKEATRTLSFLFAF